MCAAADQTPLRRAPFPPSSPIASNEPAGTQNSSNRMPASQEQLPFAVTF